jgi:hypothetical protein
LAAASWAAPRSPRSSASFAVERRFSRLHNLPIRHSILSGEPFDFPGF